MPSTDELLADFADYLLRGFSIPNARRLIERKASRGQRERLRKELDRLLAERGESDEKP